MTQTVKTATKLAFRDAKVGETVVVNDEDGTTFTVTRARRGFVWGINPDGTEHGPYEPYDPRHDGPSYAVQESTFEFVGGAATDPDCIYAVHTDGAGRVFITQDGTPLAEVNTEAADRIAASDEPDGYTDALTRAIARAFYALGDA